ncbi:MAG: acetyl-CoA carboxylase biotin carboxyl carrier protein, partial [Myxococcota bacterium]|nr:acetyl-CoA carboxylase biotin carboxyl carrier protein [Myxococcota bacterium]
VRKGQTLCIIEAMKLMNELEAECDGVVEAILVSNATAVEHGQALIKIRPA